MRGEPPSVENLLKGVSHCDNSGRQCGAWRKPGEKLKANLARSRTER